MSDTLSQSSQLVSICSLSALEGPSAQVGGWSLPPPPRRGSPRRGHPEPRPIAPSPSVCHLPPVSLSPWASIPGAGGGGGAADSAPPSWRLPRRLSASALALGTPSPSNAGHLWAVGGCFQSLREAGDGVHSEARAAEEGREMVRDGSPNPEVGVAPRPQAPDGKTSPVRPYPSREPRPSLLQPKRLPWRRIARSPDSSWETALGARTLAPLPQAFLCSRRPALPSRRVAGVASTSAISPARAWRKRPRRTAKPAEGGRGPGWRSGPGTAGRGHPAWVGRRCWAGLGSALRGQRVFFFFFFRERLPWVTRLRGDTALPSPSGNLSIGEIDNPQRRAAHPLRSPRCGARRPKVAPLAGRGRCWDPSPATTRPLRLVGEAS